MKTIYIYLHRFLYIKKPKNRTLGSSATSHFLNPWWILSLKNKTLKFWWFWDSFEGVWKENMQEGHFSIIREEVNFWKFWLSMGILGITKNSCIFWRRLFLGKLHLTSRALKQTKERPKMTSFVPRNILYKLLSRNPSLTRRCEVNKFNLVTPSYIFFSINTNLGGYLTEQKTKDKAQEDFYKLWRLWISFF